MAGELPQIKDANPILSLSNPNSKATGYDAFAKTLGDIAGQSMKEAEDFAQEASHTNLLETHGMINDLETNAKIEMYKNPGQAESIAEKTAYTAQTIKDTAVVNKADRVNLNYLADNSVRDIKFSAEKTGIDLTREKTKYSALSTFQSTLQQIKQNLYTDPKAADILINAQYSSLTGMVSTGILSAAEGQVLHKQIDQEIQRAQLRGSTYLKGDASAADINALNSYEPNPVPFSNANEPMTEASRYHGASYSEHMNSRDVKSAWASGQTVPANALMWIKNDETVIGLDNYRKGAAQANGLILSGSPWQEIKKQAEIYNTQKLKLSSDQEGFRDRLNNHIISIEKNGSYQQYIASTPDGARAHLDFQLNQAVIDSTSYMGTTEQVAAQRYGASMRNVNELVSRLNSIGIGIDVPDQYRNAVPQQYVQPVAAAFALGADPSQAINTIAAFDQNNRPYLANAMLKPTQQLTVYETGQLIGKADAGFLSDFWHSQQTGIDYKNLQTDKTGMSNDKIKDAVNPQLSDINNFLLKQPNGVQLASASTDKAIRYVKYKALQHNDPTFSHMDDYVEEYKNNIGRAYQPISSWNYTIDKNVIPLEKPQMDILSAHALAETYKKMGQYMNSSEVEEYISRNQPRVISSPTGRLTVVDQYGRAIADKNGHPAFDQFYTEGLLHRSMHDTESEKYIHSENPFAARRNANEVIFSGKGDMIEEGNIDLNNRPVVVNQDGSQSTVRTITVEMDGKTILLPTVVDGKIVSNKEAIDHYKETGDHMGVFKNQKAADEYDKKLHEKKGWNGEKNKWN